MTSQASPTTLFICESASKIKTIEKYLGKGFQGIASRGHVYDLSPKEMSIDIENNFEPHYEIIDRQKITVATIRKMAAKADRVLISSDNDHEGCFIAYSLAILLKLKKPKRLIYKEITKESLQHAIKNLEDIDMNMVHAQQCRRILDRLCGFELSPMLSKLYGQFNLSAGRVQSCVARLITDREKEITKFYKKGADSFYKITGIFSTTEKYKDQLVSVLYKTADEDSDDENEDPLGYPRLATDQDSEDDQSDDFEEGAVLKGSKILKGSQAKLGLNSEEQPSEKVIKFLKTSKKTDFYVSAVFDKTKMSYPSAPFQTSSLQQESSNKLGYSPKRTMEIAQKLYEQGYITYMRTDSITLSKEWLEKIGKYVVEEYGKKYHLKKDWVGKDKSAQEAHEAIRPTDLEKTPDDNGLVDVDQKKLYALIWKRTVASQMSAAKFNVTNIQIISDDLPKYYFLSKIEKLLFEGYLKVYGKEADKENNDADDDYEVPKPKDDMYMKEMTAVQQYSKPISRYSEATLVAAMKKLGIGRPATYGSYSQKIQDRNYVKLGDIAGTKMPSYTLTINTESKNIKEVKKTVMLGKENKRLYPTELGITITDFLVENFKNIMDYKFTADIEKQMDDIIKGKLEWKKVVKNFYDVFHPQVEAMLKKVKGGANLMNADDKELGEDSDGFKYIVGKRKHGPVVMKMNAETKKIMFAPINAPLTLKNITMKDVENLFDYPKNLGKHEKKDVILKKGKFGLYLVWNKNNYNLNPKKPDDDKNIDDKKSKTKKSDSESDDESKKKSKTKKSASESDSESDGELDDDSKDITLNEAIKIITEKEKTKGGNFVDEKYTYIVMLNGKFGPYMIIKDNKKKKTNTFKKDMTVSIPKEFDMTKLSLKTVQELFEKGMLRKKEFAATKYKEKIENNTTKNTKKGTKKSQSEPTKKIKKTKKD
jgi:DNA topoisomerase-1